MGLKVPEFKNTKKISTPLLSTPSAGSVVSPPVIRAAFGEDVGKGIENIGKAGTKIAEVLVKNEVERQDIDRLQRETNYRQDMQGLINNKEVEDVTIDGQTYQRPKGFLNRELSQANGSSEELAKEYEVLKKKYLDGTTKYQFNRLSPVMDRYFEQIQGQVATHEANQWDKNLKNSVDSNIKQKTLDASTIRSPKALTLAIKDAVDAGRVFNQKFDPATQKINNEIIASDIVEASVGSTLVNQGIGAAEELLSKMKDNFSAGTYENLKAKLDKAIKLEVAQTESDLMDMKIAGTLTETTVLRERAMGHIKAKFANTMIKSLGVKPKADAIDKVVKFAELVERNNELVKRDKAWFKSTSFEEVAQFRADALKANADGLITNQQLTAMLSQTSQDFYRDPVFQNAIAQISAQSEAYATPAAQAAVKANMYGSLMQKIIDGKKPEEAVIEVRREQISSEIEEALKVQGATDRQFANQGKRRIYSDDGGETWFDVATNEEVK